jgi:hypothetical protein
MGVLLFSNKTPILFYQVNPIILVKNDKAIPLIWNGFINP